ncbi:DUF664 domain-containing protein [Knoellia sp. CPCC 206435]|uniref:mycothiol transferase n=1 Tax=Knoellia terrae TaxID=3404797 RepID=UPI003B437451
MPTERDTLLAALAGARRHVLAQLDGLDDEALRRPVLPSGWSCLGLVRHLTLSDERYWFEVVVAGGPLDWWPAGDNADWQVGPDETAEQVVDAYRAAITASDAILAACSLEDAPRHREDGWDEDDFADVRSVVQHVVVETATHAGQLDAVRELLDGHQHIVL